MSMHQPSDSSGSPLRDLIPPKHRKRVYAYYGLLGLLLGATFAGYGAIEQGLPPAWLIVASVVLNFLAPAFGGLASANVSTDE